MNWWYNIPFFLIWTPLLLSSITAILKPRAARGMMLALSFLGIVFNSVLLYYTSREGSSFTYALGAFGAPFGNELRAGPLEAVVGIAFCVVLFLSVLGGYQRLIVHIEDYRQSSYCVMVLLLQASLMAEVYTNDMFTGYVFIEIMTIAAGGLIAARSRGRTLFASTKYMIMNMLGSGLFLMGLSVLYSLTGELLMSDIHQRIVELSAAGTYRTSLVLAIALITVGIAAKSALYPFHAWLPDAYSAATPSSSTMLSSLVSKAYIFLYIKFTVRVIGFDIIRNTHIQPVLLLYAFIGIVMGSVDAILEHKLRRMVAYSSVAQIGYIYLGIAIGSELGLAAAVLHIITHALAKSLLFLSGDRLIGASDGDATFHELRGAGFRAPLAGVVFTIGACSIVGIPVLGGFASKLYLANACMDLSRTKAIVALLVLAVSTALNAAYFLITIITLYAKTPHEYAVRIKHPAASNAALAVLGILVIGLGVFAEPVLTLIRRGVALLM